MKTRLLFLFTVLLCLPCIVLAQSPQQFNYQAVVRDVSGNPITDTDLGIKLSILQGSETGTAVCIEESRPRTNAFGLVTVRIGTVNTVDFQAIDWSAGPYFLKVEIDQSGGTSYTEMGTTQLLSVPYALSADQAFALTGTDIWKNNGSDIYYDSGNVGIGTDSPTAKLAVVGDLDINRLGSQYEINSISFTGNRGQVGFDGTLGIESVFLQGTSGKGLVLRTGNTERMRITKAGLFGIGTPNPTSKFEISVESSYTDEEPLFEVKNNEGTPVFAVYNNGVRVLIEDDPAKKGPKGGFAIGGFDPTKSGETVDFMRITPDSIRFNINNEPSKGPKGGFAIGGFDRTKGAINEDFMYITPQSSNDGQHNAFFGYNAGLNNTDGGQYNTFYGYSAGKANTSGDFNIAIGYNAGKLNQTGSSNMIIGNEAGGVLNGGAGNIILGQAAGANLTSGNNNLLLGQFGGTNLETGSNNIFIGNISGLSYADVSNQLWIGQSDNILTPRLPLISGDMQNNIVVVNGVLGHNSQNRSFFSNGSAGGTTVWYNDSDLRKKKNINQIVNALEKVLMLRGVQFEWKDISNHSPGKHVGFIAQEVAEIVPEVVDN